MTLLVIISLIVLIFSNESTSFVDNGTPLKLTPLIQANKLEIAKEAARVTLEGAEDVVSYAGYFTVNELFDSNLFFWFFPSVGDYENDPVLLWLQGGPGVSCVLGLFVEIGPFIANKELKLEKREYPWNRNHSLIFVDNPVGTGFSYTNGGYAQNQTQVGKELYIALQQFFTLFPELRKNGFFITGESYAGKYEPALAYTIYKNNPSAKEKINLQGLAIGNGLTDPINQFRYGEYLNQIGLIDTKTKRIFQENEKKVVELIKAGKYKEASILSDATIYNDDCLYKTITGFENIYHYLLPNDPTAPYVVYAKAYVNTTAVRKALHVGDVEFSGGFKEVNDNLLEDIMQSLATWVAELLDNYRILVYSGQLDVVAAFAMTENYLLNLDFRGADEYKSGERKKWFVGEELAGYVKVAGNLSEVLIRSGGHMIPYDQPKWSYDMISRFTRDIPLA